MRQAKDAQTKIIGLLKKTPGRHVSGQRLSEMLGMSRAAVWKHVAALKKAGYSITATPSKGYTLKENARDALSRFNASEIASGLETKIIGKTIYFYDELDSTNQKAMELARLGEKEGSVVIAERQSAGKGRLGRKWESPGGLNLYTSIILRPRIPTFEAQKITLMLAAAVARTVTEFSPIRPEVKWPNDILINSKKIAGILTEMDAEPDRVNFVVAGIGVNVNMSPAQTPAHLKEIATSLKQVNGRALPRTAFTQRLYSNVEWWYDIMLKHGFKPIIAEWKTYFGGQGKTMRVTAFNRALEGLCMGIDDAGALLIKTADNSITRVISGDAQTVK